MARGRSGPGANATQLGEVVGFRVGAPPGAQFLAWSYSSKNFSAAIMPKTYVNFARPQFDKVTKRGNTLDMC
jgi:hypothetical protein